jgi:hypothetical protein
MKGDQMKFNPSELPSHLRQLRQNVRNFLLVATPEELQKELELSKAKKDEWRAKFIQELIDEQDTRL